MKPLKEMTYEELKEEESRVIKLIRSNKKTFTRKQNYKYLSKIQNLIKTYERNTHTL